MIEVISQFVKEKDRVHVFKNLSHLDFISIMNLASVFVGNSSSGIIEAPSLGVPYVCIGTRQKGRERAENTIDVGYDQPEIIAIIEKAISDPVFRERVQKRKTPYGNGTASKQIAEVLVTVSLGKSLLQKKLTY
jgi:UDP-N-acetylglucosamine 2-epimerase (non-hydrolysing)/GDP/UDP-N,N'-diacetylbacillosamine 2-epimerase (hydrolysing)